MDVKVPNNGRRYSITADTQPTLLSDQKSGNSTPKNNAINMEDLGSKIQKSIIVQRNSSRLIDEHLQEIQNRIQGHALAAQRYAKYNKLMNYPIVIFSSSIIGTLLLGLGYNAENKTVKAAELIISVISFFLIITRDHFEFAKCQHEHDTSLKLYTNLLRSIEVRLINENIDETEKRDIFKDIIDQMSIIEQYELEIPEDINQKIKATPCIPRITQLNDITIS